MDLHHVGAMEGGDKGRGLERSPPWWISDVVAPWWIPAKRAARALELTMSLHVAAANHCGPGRYWRGEEGGMGGGVPEREMS